MIEKQGNFKLLEKVMKNILKRGSNHKTDTQYLMTETVIFQS